MPTEFALRSLGAITSSLCRLNHWRIRRAVAPVLECQALKRHGRLRVRRRGMEWELDPADVVDEDLFWMGDKEPRDFAVVRQLVAPGAVILDVGANFGYYGLRLAFELRGRCQVHAFEPHPASYARLCRHIEWNRLSACVRPHPVALGAHAGTLRMQVDPANTGAAYLTATAAGNTTEVQVVPLDQYRPTLSLQRLDFVKVDIEGFDCFFLDGAAATLREFRPVIMIEICPEHLARQGHTAEMVLERLRACGYRRLEVQQLGRLEPFTRDSFAGGYHHRNVFCRAA